MSNLRLIKKIEVISGVATLNIEDVFTNDFDIYQIEFTNIHQSTNVSNGIEGLRFINSSGSVISASEYAYANLNMVSGSTFEDNLFSSRDFLFFNLYSDQQSDGQANATVYIFKPKDLGYTFMLSQATGINSAGHYFGKTNGVHKKNTSITGIQLYESDSARTFGGGIVKVYGLAVN